MGLEKHLQEYYDNEGKKLRETVDKILFKLNFGGIYEKDRDDFYSVANDVMANICNTYDNSQDFNGYVWSCLNNKIKTEMTRRNRDKRCIKEEDEEGNIVYIQPISIDTPIGENENSTLSDILPSDYDLEEELSEETGLSLGENVQNYINSLSDTEKKIANLTMQGYRHHEIREKLNISENRYEKLLKNMSSFQKQIIIKRKNKCNQTGIGEEKKMDNNYTQTLEKSKPDRWSVASVIKRIDNYTIRFDHPLQRESGQWTLIMKSNLISDILQNNPIPPLVFAEQVANGLATIWNLDGKQRSTNVYSFKNDGFKISKKVRRSDISYQVILKDKNGKPLLDENGFRRSEEKTFNIGGKKFSDLPEELKDKFLDYNFEIVHYLNCKSEDIAYHLARYNEGKGMSPSQKGIIRIGEEYASLVKSISAMPFFREKGAYTGAEYSNGTVDRVVIESIMASNFLKDWKKDQSEMCAFMKNNATPEMFDDFEDVVDRLSNVTSEEVFEKFNSKDSFLYFGLYARFINTGLDDEKFVEFIAEFSALHNKEVNGVTFNSLCFDEEGKPRSTKDKYIVVPKIELMEKLMLDYLDINIEGTQEEISANEIGDTHIEKDGLAINTVDFVRENVNSDITEEDIDDYEDDLEILSLDVDNSSRLLDKENRNSLIALIAYTYIEDIDIDDWFVDYFKRSENYIKNQKENYIAMKQDLHKYILLNQREAVAV